VLDKILSKFFTLDSDVDEIDSCLHPLQTFPLSSWTGSTWINSILRNTNYLSPSLQRLVAGMESANNEMVSRFGQAEERVSVSLNHQLDSFIRRTAQESLVSHALSVHAWESLRGLPGIYG
jgi:hypothetical protein